MHRHHGSRFSTWTSFALLTMAMACDGEAPDPEPFAASASPPSRIDTRTGPPFRMVLGLADRPIGHLFVFGGGPTATLFELDLASPNLLFASGASRVCWGRPPSSRCVDLIDVGYRPVWVHLSPRFASYRVECAQPACGQGGFIDGLGAISDEGAAYGVGRWATAGTCHACEAVELLRLPGDTLLVGLPKAGGVGLAHCPEGFEEVDTQVGAFAERTCSRSSDRLSIGHTEGLIEWLTVDQASVTRPVATGVGGWREGRPGEVPSIGWGAPRLKSHTTWAFEWVGLQDDRWLASVQSYEGVVREGPMLQLWPEGGLALIGGYVDDEPDGLWVWVDYSGQATFARVFEMGAIVGEPPVRTVISDERPWP